MSVSVKPLDALLSDYDYPHGVRYLGFKDQEQDLKMAYISLLHYVLYDNTLLHRTNLFGIR